MAVHMGCRFLLGWIFFTSPLRHSWGDFSKTTRRTPIRGNSFSKTTGITRMIYSETTWSPTRSLLVGRDSSSKLLFRWNFVEVTGLPISSFPTWWNWLGWFYSTVWMLQGEVTRFPTRPSPLRRNGSSDLFWEACLMWSCFLRFIARSFWFWVLKLRPFWLWRLWLHGLHGWWIVSCYVSSDRRRRFRTSHLAYTSSTKHRLTLRCSWWRFWTSMKPFIASAWVHWQWFPSEILPCW